MDIEDINARLLATFSEIYRTRNVSKAAENLGVSQPSISVNLARLRAHFGDKLFVRTSAGMEPTPHAQQLIYLVDAALDHLKQALGYQAGFDPATSRRRFTVCMTDIAQLILLPLWLERRRHEAPNISIEIMRISEISYRALETGEIDMALGFLPEVRAALHEKVLGELQFAVIASASHPRIEQALSLNQFQIEPMIVIDCPGSGTQYAESFVRQKKLARNVVAKVPDFLGVDDVVANSDMLAMIPKQVAVFYARTGKVKLLKPPFTIPPYNPCARWHDRFHHDPANAWLRRVMMELWMGIAEAHREV